MTDLLKQFPAEKPTAAEVAIDAIREYFEDRQDASMEPGDTRFHGNKEMALLESVGVVERELAGFKELGHAASQTRRTFESKIASLERCLSDEQQMNRNQLEARTSLQSQINALEDERAHLRNVIDRNEEYAEELAALLGRAGSAMHYWMPDETMVTPPEEGEWDRCIKLIQAIDAALAKNPNPTGTPDPHGSDTGHVGTATEPVGVVGITTRHGETNDRVDAIMALYPDREAMEDEIGALMADCLQHASANHRMNEREVALRKLLARHIEMDCCGAWATCGMECRVFKEPSTRNGVVRDRGLIRKLADEGEAAYRTKDASAFAAWLIPNVIVVLGALKTLAEIDERDSLTQSFPEPACLRCTEHRSQHEESELRCPRLPDQPDGFYTAGNAIRKVPGEQS